MRKTKNYYQPIFSIDNRNAGSKATNDVVHILEELGFQQLNSFNQNKLKKVISITKSFFKVRKNDVVFFQYPLNPLDFLQHKLLKLRKVKSIAIVHDLPSIRNLKDLKEDIDRLNTFSEIIVHNEFMEQLLEENNIKVNMTQLVLFDYITNRTNEKTDTKEISFAGNLAKSSFIYDLKNINLNINVYGNNYDDTKGLEKYQGSYDSNQIVEELKGEFGLVWDGDSIKDCTGNFGKYLRFISPHKASLYLVSGKALIVWDESALSKYVIENKIGISVKSLEEIETKISNLSKTQIEEIKTNVTKIQGQLKEGIYLKKAVTKILNSKGDINV